MRVRWKKIAPYGWQSDREEFFIAECFVNSSVPVYVLHWGKERHGNHATRDDAANYANELLNSTPQASTENTLSAPEPF